MALTKLTTDLIEGSLGTDWQATPKTADFTAVAGEGYFVNTTSAAITVTLPSSPNAGDEINLVDYAGTADTNNIIITSSDNINGSPGSKLINYERGGVSIVYVDATQGWIAYNAANETAEALAPSIISVEYLVVAGGGAGGGTYLGPGGGAGGLRTSYTNTSSLNGHTESSLAVSTGTNYTVTVGAGGAGVSSVNGENARGNNGNDSIFSTITSTAGGGSGAYAGSNNPGQQGGSGGGSAYNNGSVGAAVTSPVTQGYSGGTFNVSSPYNGGGGGGANSTGGTSNGVGGDGLAVNILSTTNATTAGVGEVSGSNVYYAGGGGGAGVSFGASGGLGGGGNGASAQGESGAANTGGGGGGSERNNPSDARYPGGDGGSGVVVLRYPSDYSITVGSGITQASGSPFTESTEKVSVFTAGTGNISFS